MNVLYINSDNMRWDQLQYMPNVRNWLGGQGTIFTQARVNASLCNPSRVGTFLGQWCSHSGYNNQGSTQASLVGLTLNDQWGKWISDKGVRTGMFGKPYNADGVYHPAPTGWTTWRAYNLVNQTAYDPGFQIDDGTTTTTPAARMHPYMLSEIETFIAGSEPWFAYFAPHSPHAPYNGNFDDLFCCTYVNKVPVMMTPAQVAAAPSWIGASPGITDELMSTIADQYRKQVRELIVLDSMLGDLFQSIDLTDTIVMFTCDNGGYHGEHRSTMFQYNDMYDGALRVACVCAGPGFTAGVESDRLVSIGVDFTATAMAAFGANASHGALSGIDLTDPIPADRTILHDVNGNIGPVGLHNYDGVGITTSVGDPLGQRKLMRWTATGNDKYEMYDLSTDPEELTNVAWVPARLTERNNLESALDALIAG